MRLALLTLTLLACALCVGCGSSEKHLSRAKNYLSDADYSSAIVELQNSLKQDANSAEARWLLGKISLDTGDIPAAAKELRLAQELGWRADDVRPAMAKTLLAQGKLDAVLKLNYEDLNPSAAALLLSSQAIAAVANNQAEKADELLALALGKAPLLLEVQLARATIAVHRGDSENALSLIDSILEGAPESGDAWRLKGQALGQQGKLAEARAAFDQSIDLSLYSFPVRVARALVNVQLEDYDAAQADATELLKRFPKDPSANYVQGILHFRNNKYRSAITSLNLARPAAQQFPRILYLLSISYLLEKELDLSARYATHFVKKAPEDRDGRKLLAAVLVLQDKAKIAQDILQPALDYNPDDVQALNIMANAMLLDDQASKAMALYSRIAQLQPHAQIAPLRLEAGLVTSGATEESGHLFATASNKAANFPQTEILSILNNLAKKDFPRAIELAENYRLREFDSLAPYIVLGRVYSAAGQPADAKAAFEQVLKQEPSDPDANLGLAELALAAGDPDAARRYFKAVLDRQPGDLATLMQLTSLEARENNTEEMVSGLMQALAAQPSALEPRLRLAGYFIGAGAPEKVTPLFAELPALQRLSPRALELTALAQLAQERNDIALATSQQLVHANPASAQSHYLLAMAASANGDQQKARRALLDTVKRDSNHVPALIDLARIARSEGEEVQFKQYLATLVELAPDAIEVQRLQALSEHLDGNSTEALRLSQRVLLAAPTTQSVIELATYQAAAGDSAAARTTLLQWIQDYPKDIAVRLVLASDLERDNDKEEARAHYAAVLEQDPGNTIALNNLAWSLRLENPQEALALIRRAINTAPDLPVLLDTLAVLESLNGDHKNAQKTIQRARTALPDNLTVRYHEAMIAAALGDKDQAIAVLERILTSNAGQFPERAEAEALLQSLKG